MSIPSQYILLIIQELEAERAELLEYLTGDHDQIKTASFRGQIKQIDTQLAKHKRRLEEK